MRGKLLGVAAAVALLGVLIGFYVAKLTHDAGSQAYTVPVHTEAGHPVVDLTLQTVAALGPNLRGEPDWVSYLVRDAHGTWRHDTVWRLPANATVHVTLYQFDTATGLRNGYLARSQGIDGNEFTLDGKPMPAINPDLASHTFAVPAFGLIVPLAGVADN